MGLVKDLLIPHTARGGDLREFLMRKLFALGDQIDIKDSTEMGFVAMLICQKKDPYETREPATSIEKWLADFRPEDFEGSRAHKKSVAEAEAYEQERERIEEEEWDELEEIRRKL